MENKIELQNKLIDAILEWNSKGKTLGYSKAQELINEYERIVKLFAIPVVGNNEVVVCPEWMHKERRKQNDDNFCPICGTDIRQTDC